MGLGFFTLKKMGTRGLWLIWIQKPFSVSRALKITHAVRLAQRQLDIKLTVLPSGFKLKVIALK
jgi:hypothetical protein